MLISITVLPLLAAAVAAYDRARAAADGFATKAGVDSVYVRKDSLEIRFQRDSLNTSAQLRAIQSGVDVLVRDCQRRGRCP
jgi:hypothetical protein